MSFLSTGACSTTLQQKLPIKFAIIKVSKPCDDSLLVQPIVAQDF
jgi:hypothetical protein